MEESNPQMTNEHEIEQDWQPLDAFEIAENTNNGQDTVISAVPTALATRRRAVSSSLLSHNLLQAQMALLDNEIVTLRDNAEAYRLIRIYFADLEMWHQQHTGWRVQRGRNYFRLERQLHAITPVYTDEKLRKARDFACFAWLLWFAEKRYLSGGGRNQQFLLTQMVQDLQEQTQIAGGGEKQLDFRNQYDRFSMSRALDYLARLGGITTLEGETKKWADEGNASANEVLYEFTDITHSLVEALNQGRVEAIIAHLAQSQQSLQPARVTALSSPIPPLTRAWRALLLGPILLRYDDPEAFSLLEKQAEQVSDELAEAFGWQLELNNDYACIVRGGSLSMGSGPEIVLTSGYHQVILLLCSVFREQVEAGKWQPDNYGCLHVNHLDVAELFTDLRQRYGSHWGTTIQAQKANDLFEDLYQRMRQLGLVRGPDEQGEVLILPTAARYRVSYDAVQDQHKPRTQVKEKDTKETHKIAKQTNKAQLSLEWNNNDTSQKKKGRS
jgi:uncharacterized protein (TIGR02678 family)